MELEDEIRERKKKIRSVIDFIDEARKDFRKNSIVERYQRSCYTRVEYQFEFGGFFFQAVYGKSMFGGNSIKVWNSPQRFGNPVLSLHYEFDVEDCKALFFNEDLPWWPEFEKIMDRKDEIIDLERKQVAALRKAELLKEEELRKKAELLVQAEKVGIIKKR